MSWLEGKRLRDQEVYQELMRKARSMTPYARAYYEQAQRILATTFVLVLMASRAWAYTAQEEAYFGRVADAIYKAEGGAHTRHPYGILSVKTSDPRRTCLEVVRWRWELHGAKREGFLRYLASSYCPITDKKDLLKLNKNWIGNVEYFMS